MDISDLRTRTASELRELLEETYSESFNLKMQKATGQLSKPDQMAKNRKTIARIKMLLASAERSV